MLAILSSLNAHSFPIFQPILMILVSKFMVHRALSVRTYLSLGLLSPLIEGLDGLDMDTFNIKSIWPHHRCPTTDTQS